MKNPAAYVVGADLDPMLLHSLVKGDQVLCEMNGARIFSNFQNPLVADLPWEVVSNTEKELVIKHTGMKHKHLHLPYTKLLKLRPKEPAVFLVHDKYLSSGPIYIILQLVSHRIDIDHIADQFPMAFDAEAVLKEARKDVLDAIVEKLGEFDYPGWGYMGVCRFSLRSGVRAPIVSAFRDKDWKTISEQDDKTIVKMMQAMNWLPYLLAQSNPYNEDTLAEAPYRNTELPTEKE